MLFLFLHRGMRRPAQSSRTAAPVQKPTKRLWAQQAHRSVLPHLTLNVIGQLLQRLLITPESSCCFFFNSGHSSDNMAKFMAIQLETWFLSNYASKDGLVTRFRPGREKVYALTLDVALERKPNALLWACGSGFLWQAMLLDTAQRYDGGTKVSHCLSW